MQGFLVFLIHRLHHSSVDTPFMEVMVASHPTLRDAWLGF